MITRAIENAFALAKKKKWTKTYWAVDIHGTVLLPNLKTGILPDEFYPHAKETLQVLSEREDVKLILFTCSHPQELKQYVEFFRTHGIHFDYANENPEVETADYGCFDSKIYFNVLLEDKAG